MDVKLDKQSKIPVYLQIVDQLRAQIMCGALPSGSVLPSERGLAQMLEVHRNTVVKAYGELKSDAWIESRQGIGYVVAVPPAAEDGGEGEAGASDKPSRRVNWINEIKDRHLDMEKTFDDLFQRFTDESKYSLGSGISTNEVFRPERVAHDIAPLMTSAGCCQYFYSPYKGDKFLRQKLVSFLSTKGVKASTGEIQILSETNQAVDFIVTLLVQPGDTVVMEEPVHPDMSRAMELAGAKILTVPVDQDGMRVDLLEKLILHKHPRFIFVNSSFHDPTGHILSLERRKKIIEISNTYRVPIVEEDAASELVYEGEKLPPIKAFDTLENVIYIYSFSLTFVTGLSIAVVVANADVIRSLSYLVSVRLMASDWMTQKLLGRYLDDGTYYKALDEFRASYSRKQRLVCEKLDEMAALGVSYERPRGGVYIWCRLPDGVDSIIAGWGRVTDSAVSFEEENGEYKAQLHLSLNLCMLAYDDSAGIQFYDKTEKLDCSFPVSGMDAQEQRLLFCPQLTVTGFDYSRSAGALQVRCEVLVRGCICQLKKCSVMEEIVVDEQKPVEREDDCSLTIYYADPGENLWEIAKAYHTAMQSVLEANSQLELSQEDAVSKREMLLIPILSN